MDTIEAPIASLVFAARKKLRFANGRGQFTVEDLFDLDLQSLDRLGQEIRKEIQPREQSLLSSPDRKSTKAQKEAEHAFEIVKYVIKVKEAEEAAKKDAAAKRARAATIRAIVDKKSIEQLEATELDALKAELDELEKAED